MRKIAISIVCVLLVGTFFVVTPDMVSADQGGDYTYTVNNGVATITDYKGTDGNITIPSTLGGYSTVTIGGYAFYDCDKLTSVTIPNSVIAIGNYAFQYCHNLASVTIPGSVTTIGDFTFYNCWSLVSITIPDNVTTIGTGTFKNCYNLTSVTIPDNIIIIGTDAFYDCRSLTSMTIPNNVTTIGDQAFRYCSALTSVIIGRSATRIETSAFYSCDSLTSITFLGLVVPTFVGENWIVFSPAEIRGHAYVASNFPAPGADFHGLKMGTVISIENILPLAEFTWAPLNLTLNQMITFNASASYDPDGSLTSYEWDWNNDTVYEENHTDPTATHSWTQAGNYSVTVRVTDNDNATSTRTIIVPVSSGKRTPGFELVFVLGAIAVSILLWKKKRNV